MSIYRDKCKYQLIHPIVGTRVYRTNSLKKGAKKCYNELKSLNNINTLTFTILNVETYETFQFKINTKNIEKECINSIKKCDELKIKTTNTELIDKINKMQESIDKLNTLIEEILPEQIKNNNKNVNKKNNMEKIQNNIKNNEKNLDNIMAEAVSKNLYTMDTNKIIETEIKPSTKIKSFDQKKIKELIKKNKYEIDQNDSNQGNCQIM